MTLQKYLSDSVISTSDFARAMGITQPHAWRMVNKPTKFHPGPSLALKIEAWTGGKVLAADLNPLLAKLEAAAQKRVRAA